MNWLQNVVNIKDGTDYTNSAASIVENINMQGTNAWMIVCSALLASIGLDTNSAAIIIGAMLISPLMSPILGVGFSVGVHDRELFIHSVRNLAYAVVFSLLTSFIYFLITPLGEPTTEILARTKPTLLDIGVAFFGGVAGIVSGSRKEKSNALPGVAIATALMPPVCASGFGLATGRWDIFAGSFYLFFLNTVFISLSTYLIVKFLQFPIKSYVEPNKQKRMSRAAIAILILITVPSIWFLYTVYSANKTKQLIQTAIIDDFRHRGNEILKWETEDQDSVYLIKAFFSGPPVTEADKGYYNGKLKNLSLNKYRINFYRMNLTKNEIDNMGVEMMAGIMKNVELENAKARDSLLQVEHNVNDGIIYAEIKAIYPQVNSLGLAKMELKSADKSDTVWVANIQWDSLPGTVNKMEAMKTLQRFLQKRLQADTVWIEQNHLLKK